MVEIFTKLTTMLRCQETLAIPRECIKVFIGSRGYNVCHVRSFSEEVSIMANLFLRGDHVSSLVGCVHGLGTVGTKGCYQFSLLPSYATIVQT